MEENIEKLKIFAEDVLLNKLTQEQIRASKNDLLSDYPNASELSKKVWQLFQDKKLSLSEYSTIINEFIKETKSENISVEIKETGELSTKINNLSGEIALIKNDEGKNDYNLKKAGGGIKGVYYSMIFALCWRGLFFILCSNPESFASYFYSHVEQGVTVSDDITLFNKIDFLSKLSRIDIAIQFIIILSVMYSLKTTADSLMQKS